MAVEKKAVAKVATDAVKAAPVVKEAPKAEVKKEAPKAEKKAAEKKVAAPKAEKKAEAPKKVAEKKAAAPKKVAEKKVAAPKAAKKAVKASTEISIQYADKDYSYEKLVEIAKDVYQYDLGGKKADLKEIKLFVKPEENKVYYVLNGKDGFFNI